MDNTKDNSLKVSFSPSSSISKADYEELRKRIQKFVTDEPSRLTSYSAPSRPKYNIQEEIARAKSLKNTAFEQDIELKKSTLTKLFCFLGLETAAVFLFSFFQAIKLFNFVLEEWTFRLLITATLAQITYMLQVAVKHLFPAKYKER